MRIHLKYVKNETNKRFNGKEQMQKLRLINGSLKIPGRFILTKTKRRLMVRFPYMVRIEIVCKGDMQTSIQQWMRQKGKDKPYIPEGFVEIDGERFILEEIKKTKQQTKKKDKKLRYENPPQICIK